ncbi:vacuolar dynamin-like GTPase [Pseudohyphozyma bogoriensis]|nr:vacuolar dynamin-like GTPase [Pseudohyphozyma bogoriensis]
MAARIRTENARVRTEAKAKVHRVASVSPKFYPPPSLSVDPASGTPTPRSATPVPVADPATELLKLIASLKPQKSVVAQKIGEVYEAWELGKDRLTDVYRAIVTIGKLLLDVGQGLPSHWPSFPSLSRPGEPHAWCSLGICGVTTTLEQNFTEAGDLLF